MVWAMICLFALPAFAADVSLVGVFGSRALLIVDGGTAQPVAVGQSLGGVRVLSVQGDQAMVEVDGKKRSLRIGQHVASGGAAGSGDEKVILNADGAGHFLTTGTVNGSSVRFLVDTGATMISMGAADARRIGIDINKGERGSVQTANGVTTATQVKLDTVRVGGITMYNVDAMVHQTDLPIVLLGMSFLNRMEMIRDGSTMTLKKRY